MIRVEFEPRDIIKFELAMKELDAKVLLQSEWMPFMGKVIDIVGKYPPDFPGNTYKRTGHLGASWTKQVIDPLRGQIMNHAVYAGWVQGHEQTATHAGHQWIHAYDKAKDLLYILIEDLWQKAMRIWTQ